MKKTFEATVSNGKKTIRFTTKDNTLLCVAFRNKNTLDTYFNKKYNEAFSKTNGLYLKADIEKHPDNFEYKTRVHGNDTTDALDVLKILLRDIVKANPDVFDAENITYKTPEKK